MGVWKVSGSIDHGDGRPVFIVENVGDGLILLTIAAPGHTTVTPETAERIRTHISAAISIARGDQP
jgi:hypothetical protein